MKQITDFQLNGFAVIEHMYSIEEIKTLLHQINLANAEKDTFRKSNDLFAIRQFLKEVPSTIEVISMTN